MSELAPLAPGLALVVGVLLGTLGGGGSILAVPVLIYISGLDEKLAVVSSLIIVGVASLVSAWPHNRAGNMALRTGIIFAIGSALGAFGGAQLQPLVNEAITLILFACVMLAASVVMFRPNRNDLDDVPPARPFWIILLQGLGVGVLTGLVGVGGGMAIVPALLMISRLKMKRAIGTSLLVIGLNSASAFAGYFIQRGVLVQLETTMIGSIPLFPYILIMTAATSAGALVGTALARRVEGSVLQRAFGALLIGVAAFLLARTIPLL